MSPDNFFLPRPESKPTIYAYEDTHSQYKRFAKSRLYHCVRTDACGAAVSDAKARQTPYRIVLEESAMRNDGTTLAEPGRYGYGTEWTPNHCNNCTNSTLSKLNTIYLEIG